MYKVIYQLSLCNRHHVEHETWILIILILYSTFNQAPKMSNSQHIRGTNTILTTYAPYIVSTILECDFYGCLYFKNNSEPYQSIVHSTLESQICISGQRIQ